MRPMIHKRAAALLYGSIVLRVVLCLPDVEAQNHQRVYRRSSEEFLALRTLTVSQGVALPFSSSPYSQAELIAALDRLNPARMDDAERSTYRWLRRSFEQTGRYQEEDGAFSFRARPEISLESYLNHDPDNRFWEYRHERRQPLLRIPFEFWVTDHAYAIFDLDIGKNQPDFSLFPTYNDSEQFVYDPADPDSGFRTAEERPWSNVPIDPNTINIQFPSRAFLAGGGNHWSWQLGRDTVDWGNGYTGNLYISDYADWHDAAQISTFWERFKFSFIWVSLDGHLVDAEREFQEELVGWDIDMDGTVDAFEDPGGGAVPIYEYIPDEEHKNLIAQRWELRLWDRLGLVYTEGIMFGRDAPELRHLNPIYHFHNLYTNVREIGNSHRSFEFDLAITRGLSLYGAFSPDQWTSPLEPGTELQEEPNAAAYLAGLDYRRPWRSGMINATFEAVYSSPWMYIHNHPLTSMTTRRFVLAEHGENGSQIWYDKPLGHYGGNDFVLLWLDLGYREFGRWHVGATTYVEADGERAINSLLRSRRDDRRPTDAISEADATESAPSGEYPQWRSALRLYGEIRPWFWSGFNRPDTTRTLRAGAELAFQLMKNRYNVWTDWHYDTQLALSVTLGL